MKITPFICLSLAATLLAGAAGSALAAPPLRVSVTVEESIGPFPSWGNVKTKYGVVGDGVADDTAALQRALNDMNLKIVNAYGWKIEKPGSPAVLYFPAGTYRITKTLVSKNQFGYGLVGADPATTKIVWDGPLGGTMLIADGVYGGKFARLTWDGKNRAGIGIAHWWNKKTPQYGASPEHVDEVFVDLGVGIVAGCCGASNTAASHPGTDWLASDYGNLDSEGSVRRTKFIRNKVAGVSTESGNALDWWVMDSEFIDCYRGVTNALGAGNVHTYRNLFQRSKFADVHINYVQWHSMQGNVSVGSRRFLEATLAGNNGRALILKNNRIINPLHPNPIYMGNLGPLILIDNQILSPAGGTGPLIQQFNNAEVPGSDVILLGNKFTIANHVVGNNPLNRFVQYDSTVVARTAISELLPTLPATAKNLARKVFEVPVTTNSTTLANDTGSDAIQAIINQAAASLDANPVVHFPRATFTINNTLLIPAGRRIQLAGDGIATILKAGPSLGTKPLIRLAGPSLATLRELRLYSTDFTATTLQIDKADQPGGRILFDGTMNGVTNLNNLASTRVEFQLTTGIKKLNANAAASVLTVGSGVIGPVAVNANSNVLMLDSWYEGAKSDPMIKGDSGTFTYLGGHIAPPDIDAQGLAAGPSIIVDNFNGQFTVMGLSYNMKNPGQGILVKGEVAGTKALFVGVSGNPIDFYYKRSNNATAAGTAVGFGLMKTNRTVQQGNYGATDKAALLAGLAQARGQTWDSVPAVIPAGATDVLLYRIRTVESGVGTLINGQ
ncbi:glycosyl hydrolase family 28-related protein [Janthinobacterium sp. CG3]|uniref:glycosyl hydrolase family 28-related protein n=3 Tax=unclassified Janthinobacterium TaxID=2610881 RepID=UPI0012FC8BB7|nr:glycosyl hydrolase family 28-related protein [Janthinobacterium sp. CG3]